MKKLKNPELLERWRSGIERIDACIGSVREYVRHGDREQILSYYADHYRLALREVFECEREMADRNIGFMREVFPLEAADTKR